MMFFFILDFYGDFLDNDLDFVRCIDVDFLVAAVEFNESQAIDSDTILDVWNGLDCSLG